VTAPNSEWRRARRTRPQGTTHSCPGDASPVLRVTRGGSLRQDGGRIVGAMIVGDAELSVSFDQWQAAERRYAAAVEAFATRSGPGPGTREDAWSLAEARGRADRAADRYFRTALLQPQ
jgi:hypothetical protein